MVFYFFIFYYFKNFNRIQNHDLYFTFVEVMFEPYSINFIIDLN